VQFFSGKEQRPGIEQQRRGLPLLIFCRYPCRLLGKTAKLNTFSAARFHLAMDIV
jgi:hypothetical protein